MIEGGRRYRKYRDGRDCSGNDIGCSGGDADRGCVKHGVYYKKTLKECADMCDAWGPCKGFTRKAGDWCILKDEACNEDDASKGHPKTTTFYRKREDKLKKTNLFAPTDMSNGLAKIGSSFVEEMGYTITEFCNQWRDPQYMKKCVYTTEEHKRLGDGYEGRGI